ncbi:AAC(3) family N-acetyltransferase [Butyrivibrio fibrisolvens]|uniref:AAC(3) family N-acetyltransferase n=1 Tax=Pseudobutyrivibrio ruminis TaxID=46206 RepID=UPI0003FF58A4|nr:AAC(3) family N-acetyltransferase [Pseudobutyrivibrio ruminis]MDC7278836.1 AAC(3) family N-acetyltransferase [Butyrivibrio fibrisolvens]
MKLSLLERYGFIEVGARVFLGKFPELKKMAKRMRASKAHSGSDQPAEIDPILKVQYFQKLDAFIKQDDIVLIHSSMDGLKTIGITAEEFIDFMKKQVAEKGVTFVLPCFPTTNLTPPTEKSRPYDPKKTICWTGMLPNKFLCEDGVIRTRFPYNSLAAMGPKADEMMAHDMEATSVYDKTSAWRYCYDNHAKLLFAGVKASSSNTMGSHMAPDLMGDEWPVKDWYQDVTYKVRIDGEVSEKVVRVQKDMWAQYCMEERTSGYLKEADVLSEEYIGDCNLGLVEDCKEMMDVLIKLSKKGKLVYMIPRRYRK